MLKYYKVMCVLFNVIVSLAFYPLYFIIFYNQNISIIGTRNGVRGNDNAEYFNSFCNKNNFKTKIVYNDGKGSSELKKNSIKCILSILHAESVYITHSESDILDYWWRLFPWVRYIFIQHGVIGIKKLPDYERKNYYKYISSNEFETSIFKENFHLSDDRIIKSGLPRFDVYTSDSRGKCEVTSCLIMFTWRSSTVEQDELIINYIELVKKLCEEKSIKRIYICNHEASLHRFRIIHDRALLDERIVFLSSKMLSEAIQSADMLVTDYSSVSWDFLYQKKHIIFYTPDIELYKKNVGLYCDFNHFFGAQISNIKDVEGPFLQWAIEENLRNNTDFINKYPFYYYSSKAHSENLLKMINS